MFVNALLFAFKLVAGIVGRSGAMIADALHSASDFATDVGTISNALRFYMLLCSKQGHKQMGYCI